MNGNSSFDKEKADYICEQLATSSKSLRTICQEEGMPQVRTVLHWLARGDNPESEIEYREFLHQYAHAREAQADFMAEEIIEIADDGSNDYMTIVKGDKEYNVEDKEVTNRSRLRVDSRKWIASKLKPKKYGDRVDLTTNGKSINGPMMVEIVKPDDTEA